MILEEFMIFKGRIVLQRINWGSNVREVPNRQQFMLRPEIGKVMGHAHRQAGICDTLHPPGSEDMLEEVADRQ